MYAIPMSKDFTDVAELCGVYDINVGRSRVFVEKVAVDMPVYEDFDKMIEEVRPDFVIVTYTVYDAKGNVINGAINAGSYSVGAAISISDPAMRIIR